MNPNVDLDHRVLRCNWANQHVAPSTGMVYSLVQPPVAGLMSWLLITVGANAKYDLGLHMPGINAAGTAGVCLGLLLIVKGEMLDEKQGKRGGVVKDNGNGNGDGNGDGDGDSDGRGGEGEVDDGSGETRALLHGSNGDNRIGANGLTGASSINDSHIV